MRRFMIAALPALILLFVSISIPWGCGLQSTLWTTHMINLFRGGAPAAASLGPEASLAVLADPIFTDDDTRVGRNMSKAGAKRKTRSADSGETDTGFLQMTRSGRETEVIGAEGGFGRLLSTRREAAAISALVPERERMRALDFEASRTTALRPDLGEYRIVHFATRGMLNNIHPELSGIVLSIWKEKQWREPYYWAAIVL